MNQDQKLLIYAECRKLAWSLRERLHEIQVHDIGAVDAIVAAALRLLDLYGDEIQTRARLRHLLLLASRIVSDATDAFEIVLQCPAFATDEER